TANCAAVSLFALVPNSVLGEMVTVSVLQLGAIALGHPLGATGAKLFASLLNELERVNGRYGLLTICEGGGTANVTIIERLG
ncbi:hypothetical protein ABZ909_43620, partial [Nocardia sp. NPDC046763]